MMKRTPISAPCSSHSSTLSTHHSSFNIHTFFQRFDQFADAPDAVAKMRELVLELAVQGKLVKQRPKELPARECVRQANRPLVDVVPDGTIETPYGWLALPLGCLIATNTGGGTPSKQNLSYWNGPIPWASVKDIQSEKYLVSTIDSITEEGLKDSSSNLIPPMRLIVVTRMGLGKLAINTIPVAINQDLRAIEPTTALALDFAYLLFKSLKMVGSGVTVKGITVDKLHAMPVLLPPLAEQKRIVAKVDELMALCDRLEAQQQERETRHAALARASLARFAAAPTPANLPFLFHSSFNIHPSDLRKSILTLAVQGKLVPQDENDESVFDLLIRESAARKLLVAQEKARYEKPLEPIKQEEEPSTIPDKWRWCRIDRLVFSLKDDIRTGPFGSSLHKHDHRDSGVPVWGIESISKGGCFTWHNKIFVDAAKAQEMDSFSVKGGDIIISRSGTVGELCRLPDAVPAGLISTNLMKISLNDCVISPDYFCLLFRGAISINAQLSELCFGSTRLFLTQKILTKLLFPVPPLAEQRRIVAKVDQMMVLVDQLETQLAASRTTAANLLSALVAELTITHDQEFDQTMSMKK